MKNWLNKMSNAVGAQIAWLAGKCRRHQGSKPTGYVNTGVRSMTNTGTRIYMANVLGPGKHNHRELTQPLEAILPSGYWETIPAGFVWDGSSVPWMFQGFFPRHRHPVASCRHDWRCSKAKNASERKFADQQFREDVGKTSWAITKHVMYLGVRIGAWLGIGSNY